MGSNVLQTDVLVIGGGIGGMSAAAEAAMRGASVAVVEISEDIGGSGLLSQGLVWMPPTMKDFVEEDPDGNSTLFQVLLDDCASMFEWLKSHNVWVSSPVHAVLGLGDGCQVDMAGFFATMRATVESAGGFVVRNTVTEELTVENGAVVGAICHDIESAERVSIRASATILATGGYQACENARREHLPGSKRLVLRGNLNSKGDGIRLGKAVGAALTYPMDGFYGHLLPYPGEVFNSSDFARLAFYESEFGVLVAKDGMRFCDESMGDHINAQEVSEVGTAVLIVDEDTRLRGLDRLIPGAHGSEKWAAAAQQGGHYVKADTLEELCNAVAWWGYDGAAMLATLKEFNTAVQNPSTVLIPTRKKSREPLTIAPFHAVEVQGGITAAHGGLKNDPHGRVLDGNGKPIPGLFVAGVDAGGFNRRGYTGGLVRGIVFGRRAAASALKC